MDTGKCPGLDGIPIEFYQVFLEEFTPMLHSLYLHAIEIGTLNQTARQGILSLLDKPNKNFFYLTNWRPLALLNCDFKVFAKMLANRLNFVLPQIIHSDQKGFVKSRNIADNLMELASIIQYCEKQEIPAFVICVDFEKAFDKIRWSSMFLILRKFNVVEYFIRLVKICLTGFTLAVMNNEHRSDFFEIQCGLKQGCPFSPGGFDLNAEVIGQKLRQNKNIKGLTINNIRKIVSQFADDAWAVSEFDKLSYETVLQEFKKYEEFTGLKINTGWARLIRTRLIRSST